jgi:hypothetical protein
MSNPYSAFGTDKTATADGVWHEFLDPRSGTVVCKLKLRPENPVLNAEWRRARLQMAVDVRDYAEKHKLKVDLANPADSDTIPEEADMRIMAQNWFGSVCIDWEMTDRDGKKLNFNKTNFVKVMADLPLLFDLARKRAKSLSSFREAHLDDAVKS